MGHASEQVMLWVFIAIGFIVPGVVMWFDDSKLHSK